MKWADIKPYIAKFAPMLGTALGGPLGGAAGAVLGNILGVKDAKPEDIKAAFINGTLTGEQLVALKKADQEFELQCKAMDINSVKDLEALAVQDRDSARQREVAVKDLTPAIGFYMITTGFFGLLIFMLKWGIPEGNKEVLFTMVGVLGTAWVGAVQYYYGSTRGSTEKNQMLFNSTPTDKIP